MQRPLLLLDQKPALTTATRCRRSPSAELGGRPYWRVNIWDTDDSWSAVCHHDAEDALFDPHGLLFCAEADLDRALLRSPDLLARFADTLEHLITCARGVVRGACVALADVWRFPSLWRLPLPAPVAAA